VKSPVAVTAFLLYGALIAFLSLTPTGVIDVGSHDKSAHFLSYTVFAIFGALIQLPHKRYILLCLGVVLYSALMEYGQSFVPNREMSALDFVANSLGVLVGYGLARWFSQRWLRKAPGTPSP